MASKRSGLGIGLEALFDNNCSDINVKKTLRTSELEPNRLQPRKTFNEDSIASLAESIKEHGIIQPLLVRPFHNTYQIVAGERRWRAARMLGIDEVPVVIKELTDIEAVQAALVENLQREDLNPIEEALTYKDLIDNYSMKHENLAKVIGKSRSSITNSLRLLTLPEEVQELIRDQSVSVGHAKILAGLDDKNLIIALAAKVAEGRLTVRGLENEISKLSEQENKEEDTEIKIDSYFKEMELSLKEKLGRKVSVKHTHNKGALILEFYDKDDLSSLASKLVK
ncbi:MAG: ParB/RepB/Spo0J family partition protein [Oscillospiraceae bacterium]|nr:ParB/RepB/Spo0J family partition protein [Oscillospiraceae bacterium]